MTDFKITWAIWITYRCHKPTRHFVFDAMRDIRVIENGKCFIYYEGAFSVN